MKVKKQATDQAPSPEKIKKQAKQIPGIVKVKKPRKERAPKVTVTPMPPAPQSETPAAETPAIQEAPPQTPEAPATLEESQTEIPESETPESPFTAPITLESLQRQIDALNVQLQGLLARKRKPPVSSGRVQIRDKVTGTIYKSKNNTYKTLLKSDALKELVDRGVFGPDPAKNTFGWYALVREMPDRFEEVKPDAHE